MEAELVALATAGATALVQQMVGEGWERARTRIAGFFAARSGADEETVGAELDAARDDLVRAGQDGGEAAAEEAMAEAETEWRARMRRSLRAAPESAAELQAILDELRREQGTGAQPAAVVHHTHNTISGGTNQGVFIQAGSVGETSVHHHGGPRA
ncbi:hypothetical protein [Streptomyces laurentii]|uniref:hypothetical protein n=1 Tax=Streptomyces laurentii TaxID=39478 RepID=UPI0036CD3B98